MPANHHAHHDFHALARVTFLLVILGFVAAGTLGFLIGRQLPTGSDRVVPPTPPEMVACTMDARICPDGSAVGRIPPSCEFEECPQTQGTESGSVVCTDDAFICPDGSSVGREGPNCEFAACPAEIASSSAIISL